MPDPSTTANEGVLATHSDIAGGVTPFGMAKRSGLT
jgi:hypothetical protein